MKIKIIVVIMLLGIVLSMGCINQSDNTSDTPTNAANEYPSKGTVLPTPEFKIEITRVYETGGYTIIVYTIENIGDIPVTWLRVSAFLKDDMNKITAVETRCPSNYPDYGLKPGQVLYDEWMFNKDQSVGYVSCGVEIVNYDV